jgi:hypothetical protein
VFYTKEHFEAWREELKAEAHERAGMIYFLILRLMDFWEGLPPLAVNGWFWRLNHLLDQYGAPSRAFILHPQWDADEMRMRGFRKIFWQDLQGEEQKLIDLIKRARDEKKGDESLLTHTVFIGPEEPVETALKSVGKKKRPHSPQPPKAG